MTIVLKRKNNETSTPYSTIQQQHTELQRNNAQFSHSIENEKNKIKKPTNPYMTSIIKME